MKKEKPMEFIKKYKSLLIMGVCVIVILACFLYIMLDSSEEDKPDGAGSGELVGEYDISVNGDKSIMASLYKDGLLDIKGSGMIKDLENIPWVDHVRTIKEVKIASGITGIGAYTFYHCTLLTSVEIPVGVTSIGEHAFDGSMVSSVTIPNTVTEIGQFAFDGCPLVSLTLPASIRNIGYRAFQNCDYLQRLTIEDGVTMIGDWAFYGCKELKSITVPKSVSYIGESAFYDCEKLESVSFENTANWFITKQKNASEGEAITVLTSSANALALSNSKAEYYWKRAEK